MSLQQTIQALKRYKESHAQAYGITTIGLFGSQARGTATGNSDVDVVVQLPHPDLFMLAGIKNDLEELLHQSVDVVRYRESMNALLKQEIDRDAIYV